MPLFHNTRKHHHHSQDAEQALAMIRAGIEQLMDASDKALDAHQWHSAISDHHGNLYSTHHNAAMHAEQDGKRYQSVAEALIGVMPEVD